MKKSGKKTIYSKWSSVKKVKIKKINRDEKEQEDSIDLGSNYLKL